MKKYFSCLILCLMAFLASAQFTHNGRGMYVDRFFRASVNSSGVGIPDPNFSILGVPAKENQLLQYAKDNHITYLVLYDLHRVFGNPTYESYLCSFLQKAKTQYCVEKIGVASSCASMFDNVVVMAATPPVLLNQKVRTSTQGKLDIVEKEYSPSDPMFYLSEVAKLSMRTAAFNESCAYKFDVLVTEYEFWNVSVDDCTGLNATKDQKYQQYQTMITYMDSIRDNYNSSNSHQLYVETYLGYIDQNTNYTHQDIANWIDGTYNGKRRVDRVNLHYYGTDVVGLYSRTSSGQNYTGYYLHRFFDFCQGSTANQTYVHPIFSSEYTYWGAASTFFGSWFNLSVNNNIFTAEKAWYDDWYSDATTYNPGTVGSPTLGNVVHPGGILWFTSSQLAGHLDNPLMFTSNSPVCVSSGQNGTLQFQYVGPIEQGVSYKFYITNAGSSTVRCGSTSSIPWPAYNGATQSSINLNSALNGCSLPAGNYDAHLELTFSSCATYVAPLARVSIVNSGQIFALTSTTACQGNPVCLQASSTGNGTTTYAWYNGTSAISGATSSTYVVSPALTGSHNFSCLITSSNSTCSANRSNIIPVTINTLPAASITLQSTSGCSATLKANPTSSTYSWSNGSTGSTLTVSNGGSYSVAVTKNNCTSAALYSYNIVHADYSSQTDACGGLQNGSVTVNIYWGTSPYSLSWAGPVSGSSTGLPAGYKTINNLSAGNYVMTVTDANGCAALLNLTIQNGLAQITASSNSPVCTGNTLNLSSGGGVSYSWSGPDSFSSTLQNPSVSQASSLNAGVYTVTVAVSGGCSGTATTTVSVSTNAIYYADADGDGYGDAASTIQSCSTVAGYVTDNTDCNDDPLSNGFNIHPGASEICNNIDDNCNSLIDNLDPGITGQGVYYSDLDGDGYGAGSAIVSCIQPAQTSVNNLDCNDDPNLNGFAIHPGVTEICNGVDDNCNGSTDEGCPANVTLNLKLFIQGYYRGNSTMVAAVDPVNYPTLCDTIYVELHEDVSPYNLVYSLIGTINIDGNGTFVFPNTFYSNHYYLAIRHRNALETWSKNTVWFNSSSVSYTFSNSLNKAYGNKMVSMHDGNYALWSGDVSDGITPGVQDGLINFIDHNELENALSGFITGYNTLDLTGDRIVESGDFSLVENNDVIVISRSRP